MMKIIKQLWRILYTHINYIPNIRDISHKQYWHSCWIVYFPLMALLMASTHFVCSSSLTVSSRYVLQVWGCVRSVFSGGVGRVDSLSLVSGVRCMYDKGSYALARDTPFHGCLTGTTLKLDGSLSRLWACIVCVCVCVVWVCLATSKIQEACKLQSWRYRYRCDLTCCFTHPEGLVGFVTFPVYRVSVVDQEVGVEHKETSLECLDTFLSLLAQMSYNDRLVNFKA